MPFPVYAAMLSSQLIVPITHDCRRVATTSLASRAAALGHQHGGPHWFLVTYM
jgi:hypothetical protein